jgi:hypothetical protein
MLKNKQVVEICFITRENILQKNMKVKQKFESEGIIMTEPEIPTS